MDSFDLLKKLFPKKKKITKQPESISFNKIENLDDLLNEIKLNNPLPAPLPDKIYSALKVIANTPDWKKQLDKETKKNLETIFFKWQKQLNKTNADLSTTSAAYGFKRPEYWEGTAEEYEIALQQGLINKNTIVNIIESDKDYKGSWISVYEGGQIEEWMD